MDYSAAETLRWLLKILADKKIRPVVSEILDDVKAGNRYRLDGLFGEGAFYATKRWKRSCTATSSEWGTDRR